MGKTNFSGLSISGTGTGSGTSLGVVDAGAVTASTLSLSGAFQAGAIVSTGITLEGTAVVSLATVTNAASVVTESLALLHQGSGISLVYRSGDTLYVISGVTIGDPSLMSQAY